jgi:hypothetical protein
MPVIHSGERSCVAAPTPPNIMIMYFMPLSFPPAPRADVRPLWSEPQPLSGHPR